MANLIDLKVRMYAADLPTVRNQAAKLGISMACLVRRKLGVTDPPPAGGPNRGQGRKRKVELSV